MIKKDNRKSGSKSRHIPEVDSVGPRELERAKDAVGRKARERLAWALEFAQQDLAELTPGDLLNDRIRVRAFMRPTEIWNSDFPLSALPAAFDVAMIRRECANMLQPLKAGEIRGGEIRLTYQVAPDREGRPRVEIGTMDPTSGATLRFAELLEEYGSELRRCEDPKCRRWFIGRSNKQFCTTTCLSRVTTERLRTGGK